MLLADESYRWLNNQAIEVELDRYLKVNKVRANASSRRGVYRLVCQKLSQHLIKKCARAHSAEIVSGRLKEPGQFLIHDHMNFWELTDHHAGHLRHPEKDWEFWHSQPHREWVGKMADEDGLIPDLAESFQDAFSDWFDLGYIRNISEQAEPIRSVLYRVHKKTTAGDQSR